jgi:hypothetical protein
MLCVHWKERLAKETEMWKGWERNMGERRERDEDKKGIKRWKKEGMRLR